MNFNCKVERGEMRKYFFLIMLVVFIFNSLTVFYFEEYIGDDILWYSSVVLDQFWPSDRNLLSLHFEWPMWQLMVYSPKLTHLLYILLYMTPVSFLFYYIYRKYFGINRVVSYTAALLPHVSAHLSNFPAYTNGSYITYQLLIGLCGIVTGLWSVERSNYYYLFTSVLLFVLLSLLTEFTVFLAVPFILIFIFCFGFKRKVLILIGSYAVVALWKLYDVLKVGSGATGVNNLSIESITYRAKTGFTWLFPVPAKVLGIGFGGLVAGFVLLLVSSLLISIFRQRDERIFATGNYARRVGGNAYVLLFYTFCLVWLASVFLFTLVSLWFTPRYFYLAAFPFSLLLSHSLFSVVNIVVRYNKTAIVICFLFIIIFSGYGRSVSYYNSQSKDIGWAKIYNLVFQGIDYPVNSQLYIVDKTNHHNGVWLYNSAYIKFHAKRSDLTGHIGDDNYNYSNPFLGKREFAQSSSLEGLKLSSPLFMYRINRDDATYTQYNYFLKWDNESKESPWALYDLDQKTGAFALVKRGQGWERYLNALAGMGLGDMGAHAVAFGGCPSVGAIKRLGLTEDDLHLLKGCDTFN